MKIGESMIDMNEVTTEMPNRWRGKKEGKKSLGVGKKELKRKACKGSIEMFCSPHSYNYMLS